VDALYTKKKEVANNLIDKLQANYHNVAKELFEEESYKVEGKDLIDSHFDYIRTFTQDMFTLHE
jgi:aspartate kinase